MMAGRIHRYIAREIAGPTGIALLAFTFVLFLGRILKLAELVVTKGVPAGEIGRLFLFLLPSFLVITLPLALLLGILLGFGRLSSDLEVVAMKAAGIGLRTLAAPAFGLALAAGLLTAGLTLWAEPAGHAAFRAQIFRIASTRAAAGLQPQRFMKDFDDLVLYVEEVDRGGGLRGIMVADRRFDGTPSIVLARRGSIVPDPREQTLTLHLAEGTLHRRPPEKEEQESYQTVAFASYDIALELDRRLADPDRRRRKPKELATVELLGPLEPGEEAKHARRREAELHRRLALPLAPLLFALLGVPLGVQQQRSGRGGGFALGLVLFLLYYMVLSLAETLAVEGRLPAWAAYWSVQAFWVAAGGWLFWRACRERRLRLLDRAQELFDRVGRGRLRRGTGP